MTAMTQTTATTDTTKSSRFHWSQPRLLEHLNWLAFFVGSIIAFGAVNGDWLAFILLLLVPDVFMLGYALNRKVGAWIYNIGHSYALAVAVIVAGFALDHNTVLSVGIILMGHIGMDQMLGFGYKYADSEFSDTHMGRI